MEGNTVGVVTGRMRWKLQAAVSEELYKTWRRSLFKDDLENAANSI